MRRILPWAVVSAALLGLALVVLFTAMNTPTAIAAPPQQASGQQLWEQRQCKNCHGAQGEGKYGLPLAGTQKTAAEWITQVHTPRQNMPAYTAEQISDADITAIHDYMATLQKPASFTPVRYEAKPDDAAGKVTFMTKRCVACHGEDYAATAKGILASGRTSLTAAEVEKQLRTPRRFMPHFSEAQVPASDVPALTDFLNTQIAKVAGQAQAAGTPAAGGTGAGAAAAATPSALPTTGGDPSMLALGLASLAAVLGFAGFALRRNRR
ncbi:MAG: c-type cytochrome [Anaerolineae bacterium]